jgi:hypothetical protein
MCMPRNFGAKLIDGKLEEKSSKKKSKNKNDKKIIHQVNVEFEDENTCKRD